MRIRVVALTFLLLNLAILLFICERWYNVNNSTSDYELGSDGRYATAYVIITIYYFALTVWTFWIYKKAQQFQSLLNLQLILTSILCIMPVLYLLYEVLR